MCSSFFVLSSSPQMRDRGLTSACCVPGCSCSPVSSFHVQIRERSSRDCPLSHYGVVMGPWARGFWVQVLAALWQSRCGLECWGKVRSCPKPWPVVGATGSLSLLLQVAICSCHHCECRDDLDDVAAFVKANLPLSPRLLRALGWLSFTEFKDLHSWGSRYLC